MRKDEHPFRQEDDAATPLTNDERSGLIPSWVTFRHELNEVEQANILSGSVWAFRQRRRDLLQERFLQDLHKRMLGDVWTWAGNYRTTERNIGVSAWQIAPELRGLLDDTRLWKEQFVFAPDEIAVRFHHRLVSIHPFPNGNGRHASRTCRPDASTIYRSAARSRRARCHKAACVCPLLACGGR